MKRNIVFILVLVLLASSSCSHYSPKIAENPPSIAPSLQPVSNISEKKEIDQRQIPKDKYEEEEVDETITPEEEALYRKKMSIKKTKGVIVPSEECNDKFIHFYNKDGSLWYKFRFPYTREEDGEFKYENKNFEPFYFNVDYYKLALKYVDEDKNRYEVIVNEGTGLRKFVKKNNLILKFQTWEKYLPTVHAVEFSKKNNPLRKMPNGKQKVVDLSDIDSFQIVTVKGEWAKVRLVSHKSESNSNDYGWIRWKQNQRIIIHIYHLC